MALAKFFDGNTFPGDIRQFLTLAEVFGWGGSVALIILLAAALDPRGWRVVPQLVAGAFLPGLLVNCLKLFIGRLRPVAANLGGTVQETFVAWLPRVSGAPGNFHGYEVESFPSGHAATATGLAVALTALYPRGRWLFMTFALLACLQRLDARAHFASDVLAGASLGCLFAAALQLRRKWSIVRAGANRLASGD